jgi:hypothetical protein
MFWYFAKAGRFEECEDAWKYCEERLGWQAQVEEFYGTNCFALRDCTTARQPVAQNTLNRNRTPCVYLFLVCYSCDEIARLTGFSKGFTTY